MVRLAELDRDELTERQRESHDRIGNGPRQGVRGPFPAWLRSPALADAAEAMGDYLRFESPLDGCIKELAVLMVARRWRASYVWRTHLPLALEAGLPADAIEAIRLDSPPALQDPATEIAHLFLGELLDDQRIRDRTWAEATTRLGERAVIDLIAIAGYYGMVVMTVVATGLGEELPDPFLRNAPRTPEALSALGERRPVLEAAR